MNLSGTEKQQATSKIDAIEHLSEIKMKRKKERKGGFMCVAFQDQVPIEPLKKALDIIIESIDPEKIILFGSHATGRSDENSDYDLCILKQTTENRNHLEQQLYLDLYDCNEPIEFIIETPENFERLKSNNYLIYFEIDQHGVVLYEK